MVACSSGLVRAREGPLLRAPGHVSTGLSNFSIYFSILNAPLLQLGYIDISFISYTNQYMNVSTVG